ncbi:peptidoglycan/LPS O-acetylase OafA/YrhL [Maribacter spongiicola]|uniref:Peptidoglycan/LPS O-acetylase OafA/YrhL n=1 Tax=Maribacter spongiicola TaxID=1206753 RepID=A0A4V3ER66_9FLAO|nr:acyltransferase [Maribacter spongiicola]TDT44758.1 peptidoglycan/LPS O-acetylase OafA/YrhL [Maribacter spongiicola]
MIRNNKFFYSVHYFRGIAILAIMLTHVWLLPNSKQDYYYDIFYSLREALFDGSTIYFVLISGFLLNYLKDKFEIKRFYKSKIKNVISPYVFISICILIATSFFGTVKESFHSFLYQLPEHLINGTASGPFWYIPFIIPFFLAGPLIIKITQAQLHKLLPLLLFLPILGTRTGVTVTLQMYLYFFPIYLLGIYSSMNYETVITFVRHYITPLVIGFVFLSITIFHIVLYDVDLTYCIFSLKDGLVYLKCLLAAMLLIRLCDFLAAKNINTLDSLARYSFAFYFLHDFINYRLLFISIKVIDYFNLEGYAQIIWGLIWGFVVILITAAIILVAKIILGKYSRVLIGA